MVAAGTTAGQLLDDASGEAPDTEIAFPAERTTFRELAAASVSAAASLLRLGVGPGDSVGVLAQGGLPVIELIMGAARVGAVIVPLNARFKARELRYVVDNADLRVLVVGADLLPQLHEALPSLGSARPGRLSLPEAPALRRVLVSDGPSSGAVESWLSTRSAVTGDEAALRAVQERQREVSPDEPALMMYTSGTTAHPRGCLISHSALVHQGAALAERLRLTSEDRFWTPLPFFHVGGFDVLFASLSARATMLHVGVFDPRTALRQLVTERCTVAFPAFETIWLPVLNHPDFPAADLSHLRLIINVGTPERMRSMQERVPHAIQISCTGSTEATGFCCVGSLDDPPDVRAAVSGPMVEGMEGRIVDPETGRDVPDGTVGEFLFRGTFRLMRYHRAPELNAERIDADGWFHTGDALVRDAAGRFTYVGRLADRLKVGGENVSPAEVEDFLASHPAVGIVQVVAAPDAHYGEVGAAFVQLTDGSVTSEEELINFCRGHIASFKIPRYVRFVTEWPMSGTKIQKFVLRERIAEELAEKGITEAPRISSTAAPAAREAALIGGMP